MELNSLVACERAFRSLISDGRNELKYLNCVFACKFASVEHFLSCTLKRLRRYLELS